MQPSVRSLEALALLAGNLEAQVEPATLAKFARELKEALHADLLRVLEPQPPPYPSQTVQFVRRRDGWIAFLGVDVETGVAARGQSPGDALQALAYTMEPELARAEQSALAAPRRPLHSFTATLADGTQVDVTANDKAYYCALEQAISDLPEAKSALYAAQEWPLTLAGEPFTLRIGALAGRRGSRVQIVIEEK